MTPIRVLLVEDDEDDFVLTRDLLAEGGRERYELDWVRSYEAGRDAIVGGGYDVHLIDYRLGARHGLELLEESLAAGCTAPLILLTGQEEEEIDRQAMQAGAADYIAKSNLTASLLERSIRYAIERSRSLEALRRSESNFRSLIERAPDAVAVERGGRIVYVNPVMVGLLGAESAEALTGRPLRDYVHPDDRISFLTGRESTEAREMRLVRPGGEVLTVDLASLSQVMEGEPAVVTFARDVSERKRMQDRLVLADRLASVGTLAAGVAHEVNNPLASVISNLGWLASEMDQMQARIDTGSFDAEQASACVRTVREIVVEAQEGADRVKRIVSDLKMVSRREVQADGTADVRDVLESAVSVVNNEIRRRARLVRDCAPVPRVKANDAQLGQVFVNLLLNAAQAITEGAPEANEIRIVTRIGTGGTAVIEVSDTGCGIPAESVGRLFDPFFTTKPVGTGTGLGLSICDGIVTSLGGRIEVESEPGRGSLFRVVLPGLPA